MDPSLRAVCGRECVRRSPMRYDPDTMVTLPRSPGAATVGPWDLVGAVGPRSAPSNKVIAAATGSRDFETRDTDRRRTAARETTGRRTVAHCHPRQPDRQRG